MADAARLEAWQHTSALMATIVNVNRTKKGRPISPDAFNPMIDRRRRKHAGAMVVDSAESREHMRKAFAGAFGRKKANGGSGQ
jgi:hypothetical protein